MRTVKSVVQQMVCPPRDHHLNMMESILMCSRFYPPSFFPGLGGWWNYFWKHPHLTFGAWNLCRNPIKPAFWQVAPPHSVIPVNWCQYVIVSVLHSKRLIVLTKQSLFKIGLKLTRNIWRKPPPKNQFSHRSGERCAVVISSISSSSFFMILRCN